MPAHGSPRRQFVIHVFAGLATASAPIACKRDDTNAAPRAPTMAPSPNAPALALADVHAATNTDAPDASLLGSDAALSDSGVIVVDASPFVGLGPAENPGATNSLGTGTTGGFGRMGGGGAGTIGLGTLGTTGGSSGGHGYGYGAGARRRRPDAMPLVRAAPLRVSGPLSVEAVRRVVLRNLAQIVRCYEQGLTLSANLEGRVAIRFVIGSAGAVLGSTVLESNVAMPAVGQCMAASIRRWQFPLPEGGGTVTVDSPFNLQHPD